jgi:hypothetical protein
MSHRLAAFLAIPLLGAGSVAAPAGSFAAEPSCGAPGPAIWPVASRPYDRSFEQWASGWWQWAFSLPTPSNPLLDETGEQCMVGQQGRVWNLAGVPGSGAVTRQCEVPCDRALFFPLFNAFNINVAPPPYASDEELEQILVDFIDQVVSSVAVELDGKPLTTIQSPRIRPHFFSYTLPGDNILLPFFGLNVPAGAYAPAVDDGYYVMLSPLPPGPHTLHFTASGSFSGGDPEVLQDVTYELEVVAPPSIPVPQ